MRFLKSQYVSKYSPNDNTVRVNSYGRGVMDFNGAVMIPKGTTAQRPQLTGVRHPIDGNGYIRYNIDNDAVTGQPIGIEAYVGGAWQVVRGPAVGAVSIETLGPGDATETVFGPLSKVPASANNIIVLVENVMQIPTTNFTLEQSASGSLTGPSSPYADGWYLKFTSPVPLAKNVTVFFGFAN